MIDEMVVKNLAKRIFEEMGVPWSVLLVVDDKPSKQWVVNVHIESPEKTFHFATNKGSLAELEESIRRHVRTQQRKLESN